MKNIIWTIAGLSLLSCAPIQAPSERISSNKNISNSETLLNADVKVDQKVEKIGVQLYTLRKEMEVDFEGTLRKVAALGYDELEFAGLYGRDPRTVKALVTRLGMDAVSSHIFWSDLKKDPAAAIAETKALGARYMVLAWLPLKQRDTIVKWKEWIIFLNKVGKLADQAGVKFAYHNHEFEFQPIDGVLPYDLMLEQLDPQYIDLELDLYWTALAGVDPIQLFKDNPGRFTMFHVKDMNQHDDSMVDVGSGRIDFAAIFTQQELSGAKHYFVEHDSSAQPLVTLKNSINYLQELRY